jgi:PhzF family phenazine biosynthesis protein
MRLPFYQADAFSAAVFGGNPAGVCPLDRWLPDAAMQAVAAENNLPETAFFVPAAAGDASAYPGEADYHLTWFTPTAEVDLCGHATLAAGFVVLGRLQPGRAAVRFATKRAGVLTVAEEGGGLALDLPAGAVSPAAVPSDLARALGARPRALHVGPMWLAEFASEEEVAALAPDVRAVASLPAAAVVCTAPGRSADFVSRCFAPALGIDEDPVTGAAHTLLAPFWAERLGRAELSARQISRRGGDLRCRMGGGRVTLVGTAALYLEGTLHVPG